MIVMSHNWSLKKLFSTEQRQNDDVIQASSLVSGENNLQVRASPQHHNVSFIMVFATHLML